MNSNSTENTALLYYENPVGNVSALLQRTFMTWHDSSAGDAGQLEFNWLDITSQSDKSLPSDFLNTDPDISHTLWESGASTRFGTPFTSRVNFSQSSMSPDFVCLGALFYAPDSGMLVADSYSIRAEGSGIYSGCMRLVYSHHIWFPAS